MPDWLDSALQSDSDLSVSTLIARQLIALVLGCVIGFIYRWTVAGNLGFRFGADGRSRMDWRSGGMYRGGGAGRGGAGRIEMVATLALITVLIAMMTMVIGDNIARAFAIVGALSIVRFRTVVEDTRDTAFVICAVAVGMAVGAGHILIPLITIPIVAAIAFILQPPAPSMRAGDDRSEAAGGVASTFEITVRTGPSSAADASIRAALATHVQSLDLVAIESARQGAAIETTYAARLQPEASPHAVLAALNAVEGVQNVELRRR